MNVALSNRIEIQSQSVGFKSYDHFTETTQTIHHPDRSVLTEAYGSSTAGQAITHTEQISPTTILETLCRINDRALHPRRFRGVADDLHCSSDRSIYFSL